MSSFVFFINSASLLWSTELLVVSHSSFSLSFCCPNANVNSSTSVVLLSKYSLISAMICLDLNFMVKIYKIPLIPLY